MWDVVLVCARSRIRAQDFDIYNAPTIQTVLDCTFRLVIINGKASTAHLLYLTFQEYLGGGPGLFVTTHSVMAETCLTYLNRQSVRTLLPGVNVVLVTTPFLQYAALSVSPWLTDLLSFTHT